MDVHGFVLRAGAAFAVGALLVGCSSDSPVVDPTSTPTPTVTSSSGTTSPSDDVTPTTSAMSTPTASPSETASATSFPADTETDVADPEGDGTATLTGVTTRTGPGYDEIVFAESGDGRMGWFVGYTDDPRSDGSGDPVAVAGDVVLEVRLRGITAPFEDDASRDTTDPDVGDAEYLAEIIDDAWFEGQWTFFVGLDRERPFRMFRGDDGDVHLQIATG